MRDYILNAAVCLRRNYADLPFDAMTNAETAGRVSERVMTALERTGDSYTYLPEGSLPDDRREELAACRLICPDHRDAVAATLFLNLPETAGVETAGEDHLLISAYDDTGNVFQALAACQALAALMEDTGPMARSAQFGFLTAHPCDAGTGLRASLLLHLPMTALVKQAPAAVKLAAGAGCTLRPVNGGCFSLENRVTLGQDENTLLQKTDECAKKLCALERTLRWRARERKDLNIADKAWRAYGVARYALRASALDVRQWWSALTLGSAVTDMPYSAEALEKLWELSRLPQAKLTENCDLQPDVERARRVRALFDGGS